MAYIGVRTTKFSYKITTKLHGPIDTLVVNPVDVRNFVNEYQDSARLLVGKDDPSFNMVIRTNELVEAVADKFCDGTNILWVEVTIESSNNVMFNAVAERVPVNV